MDGRPDAEYEDQHERERFAQRRADANLPADREHHTKLEIALDLIEEVGSTAINLGCVVADIDYGESRSFRQKLRDLKEPYLMEVPSSRFQCVPEDTELLRPEDEPNRSESIREADLIEQTAAGCVATVPGVLAAREYSVTARNGYIARDSPTG